MQRGRYWIPRPGSMKKRCKHRLQHSPGSMSVFLRAQKPNLPQAAIIWPCSGQTITQQDLPLVKLQITWGSPKCMWHHEELTSYPQFDSAIFGLKWQKLYIENLASWTQYRLRISLYATWSHLNANETFPTVVRPSRKALHHCPPFTWPISICLKKYWRN